MTPDLPQPSARATALALTATPADWPLDTYQLACWLDRAFAIAAADTQNHDSRTMGCRPESAPQTHPDAPAIPAADVSAHSRPVETEGPCPSGARGTTPTPETQP